MLRSGGGALLDSGSFVQGSGRISGCMGWALTARGTVATDFSAVRFYKGGSVVEEIETDLSRTPGVIRNQKTKSWDNGKETGNSLIAESLRGEKSIRILHSSPV